MTVTPNLEQQCQTPISLFETPSQNYRLWLLLGGPEGIQAFFLKL